MAATGASIRTSAEISFFFIDSLLAEWLGPLYGKVRAFVEKTLELGKKRIDKKGTDSESLDDLDPDILQDAVDKATKFQCGKAQDIVTKFQELTPEQQLEAAAQGIEFLEELPDEPSKEGAD